MPNVVRLTQVIHQRGTDQDVPKECSQNGGPDNGVQALDVEDVNRGGQRKTAGGEHHAAQYIKADPDAPGELIIEVGGCAQPLGETYKRGVKPARHQKEENQFPERQPKNWARHYRFPPFFFSRPSTSATSSRR